MTAIGRKQAVASSGILHFERLLLVKADVRS